MLVAPEHTPSTWPLSITSPMYSSWVYTLLVIKFPDEFVFKFPLDPGRDSPLQSCVKKIKALLLLKQIFFQFHYSNIEDSNVLNGEERKHHKKAAKIRWISQVHSHLYIYLYRARLSNYHYGNSFMESQIKSSYSSHSFDR